MHKSLAATIDLLGLPLLCDAVPQEVGLVESPPLSIIGYQHLLITIPKGWKVVTLPEQYWNTASYDFDLVPPGYTENDRGR